MPWRDTTHPYRILVSEVMLQQTQVDRVIPKYNVFIKKFPSFKALAEAKVGDVLRVWQGLGYNRRALNLKKAAEMVVREFGGSMPKDVHIVDRLPGVGLPTAGAILAYAFNLPVAFVETNIRSVYIHFFFSKAKKVSDEKIVHLVEKTISKENPREWFYALMDYGAMLKKTFGNESVRSKHYVKQSTFKGSKREVRGKIVRLLTQEKDVSLKVLPKLIQIKKEKLKVIVHDLEREGFLRLEKQKIILA